MNDAINRSRREQLTIELIQMFRDRFNCIEGEPKAFFEIPQRGADPVRGIYVVYSVKGRDLTELRDYFVNTVIIPLAEKAASDNDNDSTDIGGPFLYWRMKTKVEVTFADKWWKIYTRICVLDDNLDQIRIDDMVKDEGSICAYSAGAY